jgi:uncharacterized membrane protein YedE/YeeE
MMTTIPWESLAGGMLLGLSATLLMLFNGKVAGISGVCTGILLPKNREFPWRVGFAFGMVAGGFAIFKLTDFAVPQSLNMPLWLLVIAGLLVGIGTRLGNGCTSGHGICGVGRLSHRSLVATATFMIVAIITVYVRLHML